MEAGCGFRPGKAGMVTSTSIVTENTMLRVEILGCGNITGILAALSLLTLLANLDDPIRVGT